MTIASKLANKKVLLPAGIVIVTMMAVNLIGWGLPKINADTTNQTATSSATAYTQLPKNRQ